MRRFFLIFCLSILALFAKAQVRFGYLSYDSVMKQMPEYVQARQSLAELKATYEKEATHNEEEFQRKFAEFLDGQKDFPINILQKRQSELQDLMDKGIAFRRECQQLLSQADSDFMQNVQKRLDEAIRQVGYDAGYAYIINTDGHSLPFINPLIGEDVTTRVLIKLGLVEPPKVEPQPETVSGEQTIPSDSTHTECAEDTLSTQAVDSSGAVIPADEAASDNKTESVMNTENNTIGEMNKED